MSRLIGTFFGVGYLPWAPGTWGTAAALPAAYVLYLIGGFPALLIATVIATLLGWWATYEMTKGRENHDPSEVVIDEVVGMWITLMPVFIGASHADVDVLRLWPGWIAGFILFRIFDITKIGPIGWADRQDTALGVMLDDVFAGIAAAICVGALAWLFHGMLSL